MRKRGAAATDLCVLVVAADEGVKAQTLECIDIIKKARTPVIVALNKMDKDGADPARYDRNCLFFMSPSSLLIGGVIYHSSSSKI